jgi:hypothetical protein
MIDTVRQDLRFALRLFRHRPAFTLLTVLTFGNLRESGGIRGESGGNPGQRPLPLILGRYSLLTSHYIENAEE